MKRYHGADVSALSGAFRSKNSPGASCLALLAIATLTSIVYGRRLTDVPAYIGGDEAYFATHAYAIATTGRDLNGHALPVLFNITDPLIQNDSGIWYQPMLVYVIALVLKFRSLTEWTIRLPMVMIGVVNALLMYAVARRIFSSVVLGALAALILVLTPAHFLFCRQTVDYVCPLPFVLAWLWCVIRFHDTRETRWLTFGGALLGVGLFSYVASWVMMPFYLALTLLVVGQSPEQRARRVWATGLGFALPLLVLLPWLWFHWNAVGEVVARYRIHESSGVIRRLAVFWQYFDPAYLFFSGSAHPTQSTRTAGIFPLASSALLIAGILYLWRDRRAPVNRLLLIGFVCAPLAVVAAMPADPFSTGRGLYVLPFGVLISMFGVVRFRSAPAAGLRAIAVLLLLGVPLQFWSFLRDYYSGYRTTSAMRFDATNFRAVAEYVIASDTSTSVPAVYLSRDLDDGGIRWKFYLLRYRRDDLWVRTHSFSPTENHLTDAERGSLLVLYPQNPRLRQLIERDGWVLAKVVFDISGAQSAMILRKGA